MSSKVSQHFKYFGMAIFTSAQGPHMASKKQPSGDRFAIAWLHLKLHDLDVGPNVELAPRMYSSIVEPVLLYGCEVWMGAKLHAAERRPANSSNLEVEQVHRNFMGCALRVRKNTSTWVAGTGRLGCTLSRINACITCMLTSLRRVPWKAEMQQQQPARCKRPDAECTDLEKQGIHGRNAYIGHMFDTARHNVTIDGINQWTRTQTL
jgi:hypothetical protein